MGTYTFKWEHPAEEVFVTGTFDNWTKTEQLEKQGDVFQKSVLLKDPSQKIYYKFVVDGAWTINESAAKEADHEGNINNFITPEDIIMSDPAAALINTVTPASTTAELAGAQPIEKREETATLSDVPGGFPQTPSNELEKPVGINPLPAAAGAVNPVTLEPGEKVPDVAPASLTDNVKLDKESYEKSDALPGDAPAEDKTFSVNPLPAAIGAINPIKLEPGEKVPDVNAATINDHVKLDKESYEKSDALPGIEATDLPPITSNLIPESSLPVIGTNDVHINTVAPGATTLGLAADVPLESKVPEIVKESQEKAGVDPEASIIPQEVEEKSKVEDELKQKVTEAPSTSEGTAGVGTEKSEAGNTTTIAAAAATTAAAITAAVVAAKDSLVQKAAPAVDDATTAAADVANKNLSDTVKQSLPEPVQETLAQRENAAKEVIREEVSPEVPAEVKESLTEAGKSPEAAAYTTAVEEKKEVEAQLLDEVKPKPAIDETPAEETVTAVTTDAPATVVSDVAVTKEEVDAPVSEAKDTATTAPEVPAIDTTTTTDAVHVDVPAVDTPVTETDKTEVAGTETTAAETSTPNAANGSNGTKAAEPSAVEKKKKNRLSSFFSRIKHKLSE